MYKQGDILGYRDGIERKVLGVCGGVYFMSMPEEFNKFGIGWTKEELDKKGCELKVTCALCGK